MVHLKKLARITLGFILIPVGLFLALPGVPGPGLAIAATGVVLLSDHFEWARKMTAWGKVKIHAAKEWWAKRKANQTGSRSSAP